LSYLRTSPLTSADDDLADQALYEGPQPKAGLMAAALQLRKNVNISRLPPIYFKSQMPV